MKKDISKRIIAALIAFTTALSMTACGSKNETAEETLAVSSIQENTDAEADDTTISNIFDENYDPLADDYDPYSDGAAATVTGVSAVTKTDETTIEEKAEETKDSQEKPVTQTEAPAETTKPAASENKSTDKASDNTANEDVQLILSTPNGWNDGTNDFSQLDGTIRNNGKTNVENWTATIQAAAGTAIEQSWNCEITINKGTLTVKPVEHNKSIAPGGEGTFGFILKNPGKIDSSKASVSCSTGTYSATGNSGGNNSNKDNSGSGKAPSSPVYSKDVPAPSTDDWLFVKGSKIVDKNGKEVWLTGINWFGYNTGTNTFDGLWTCDLNKSLASIADRGFNLLRVPISAELINNWASGNYPTANYNQATNSYLNGMNSLEIFDYVIGQCRANGLKIMIDIHSAKTDSMGHMKNVWYEGDVSEQDYLDALSWMADRYKNDDTIIAYDLKNEPHGKANESPRAKWDNSKDPDNWKYIAEKAAMAVLNKNPNALVMVEGIEIYPKDISSNGDFSSTNAGDYYSTWWGGNLRGVKDNPIDLGKYQNKLVYSPHDYGPAVYQQEWFKGDYTYDSLYKQAWYDNWFYIQDTNTAPLLIGEWGGFMTQPNLKWMTYLRQLIKEYRINHTFWCFNANSGDTGGLVKDDFTTWDEEKYAFVKEVLWQENGKFVGLDHEIPLGSNGKTLS